MLVEVPFHEMSDAVTCDGGRSETEEVVVEDLPLESLVEYARYGSVEVISQLAGAMMADRIRDARDVRGNTMLHMHAANGHLDCVAAILGALEGAPLSNVQNDEGNTPLHWACMTGQLEVVRLLCTEGQSVASIENKAERTPICEAERQGHGAILDFFQELLGRKDPQEAVELISEQVHMNVDGKDMVVSIEESYVDEEPSSAVGEPACN